ncbi:MAG: hypothetical protein ACTSRH_06965 [Promethearchaeota archaeon]
MENKNLFALKVQLLFSLVNRGFLNDIRLFKGFLKLELQQFVPRHLRKYVRLYDDAPSLFYYDKQNPENLRTISAPHMITIMLQNLLLEEDDDLLILGAKSGYIAALAHEMAPKGKIYILEANSSIAKFTAKNIRKLNLEDCIKVIVKNPLEGMPELKPWQKILVTGAIRERRIYPLLSQLDPNNGVLFAPIGGEMTQIYTRIARDGDNFTAHQQLQVRFTPLITQLEIDELKLITDISILESEEDEAEVERLSREMKIKYINNIEDQVNFRHVEVKEETKITPERILKTLLECINDFIDKLREAKKSSQWSDGIEIFLILTGLIRYSKKIFKINIDKIENTINQLKDITNRCIEIERKINGDPNLEQEKKNLIEKQQKTLNDLQGIVSKELGVIVKKIK